MDSKNKDIHGLQNHQETTQERPVHSDSTWDMDRSTKRAMYGLQGQNEWEDLCYGFI